MLFLEPADFVGRPVDFVEDATHLAFWLVLLLALDQACIRVGWFPEPRSSGRYFTLHVIVNAFVTVVYFDAVLMCYARPATSTEEGYDGRGMLAIFALHVYHVLMYRPLATVDWVHHIVMMGVMLPLAYLTVGGRLMGHGCFFASGLPGGLDYLMLVLVKKGWMHSSTEKRINCEIQAWLRAPGCIAHVVLVAINLIQALERYSAAVPMRGPQYLQMLVPDGFVVVCATVNILSFYWNGMYFLRRVTDNYAVKMERERVAQLGSASNGHNRKDR